MHAVKDKRKQYPARTPYEARARLKELEQDQARRVITPARYIEERRRLVRLAIGGEGYDRPGDC